MKERKAVTREVERRYGRARKKGKGRMLDEFCELTGYNRSYAARVLRGGSGREGQKRKGRLRGRARKYGPEVLGPLRRLWAMADGICGPSTSSLRPFDLAHHPEPVEGLLGELGEVGNYKSGLQVTAQAGLTPQQFQSGSSIRGKPRLSKMGNVHLRKGLYMCVVVAKNHNPATKAFCDRLLAAGKPTLLVIAAAMRKLLVIAFAVLKSHTPFNPNYQPCFA